MPMAAKDPSEPPRLNRVVNRSALAAAIVLAGIGLLRLVNVLATGEKLPLRPLDGWLWMSLRFLAVLFSLGMLRSHPLRQRYLLLLLALVLLTSAGLGLRLGSLLPAGWQPTAGAAQLVLSVLGLGMVIAGLAQGEDLVELIRATWGESFTRPTAKPPNS
jgi:hypothetical protein